MAKHQKIEMRGRVNNARFEADYWYKKDLIEHVTGNHNNSDVDLDFYTFYCKDDLIKTITGHQSDIHVRLKFSYGWGWHKRKVVRITGSQFETEPVIKIDYHRKGPHEGRIARMRSTQGDADHTYIFQYNKSNFPVRVETSFAQFDYALVYEYDKSRLTHLYQSSSDAGSNPIQVAVPEKLLKFDLRRLYGDLGFYHTLLFAGSELMFHDEDAGIEEGKPGFIKF